MLKWLRGFIDAEKGQSTHFDTYKILMLKIFWEFVHSAQISTIQQHSEKGREKIFISTIFKN